MEIKNIPIFFSFNNDYIEPAAVAIYSLLNKTPEHIFYKMYVLCSNIPCDRQQIVQNIVKRFNNAELSFIDTHGEFEEIFENKDFSKGEGKSVFTADILSKCFAAKFFPQYDKIIYSDVDVVFADDISEIYDTDLDDKYLAGVRTPFAQYHKNELSHLKTEHYELLHDKYIAGGIWVMNLKKIRQDNIENKMISIMTDPSIEKRWPEQDIINIACGEKVKFLPLNYISYPYMITLLNLPDFKSDFSKDELYDSIINPKIIHFAAEKPWNGNPNYSNLWWTYFNYLNLQKTHIFKTPESPEKRKIKKYKKLFRIFLGISIFFALTTIILMIVRFL